MRRFRYKSRFALPLEESDFVCALAGLLGSSSPDDALAALIRVFARDNPDFARLVWARARADGRGGWRKK